MKKLINYNRVVFKAGGWFTKFWMITMPIFTIGAIISMSQMPGSWPMLIWFIVFTLFYPIRNYMEVDKLIKRSEIDEEFAHDYKRVLDIYESVKNKNK